MADPTKGPWWVGHREAFGTYNPNTIYAEGDVVALVYGIPQNTTLEEMAADPRWSTGLANARLIALAPEMRDLLTELERTTVPDGSGNSWCAFCRVVRYEERSSHTATCRLGNLLKRMEGAP